MNVSQQGEEGAIAGSRGGVSLFSMQHVTYP